MRIKSTAAFVLAAALTAGSMTAIAEENQPVTKTVTAQDGLITIDLPNEKWYAITTADCAAEFSDGDCGIRLNVYKMGDTIPAATLADSMHGRVYETIASTTEYVYTLTGLANTDEDYNEVFKSVNSAKIDLTKITAQLLNPTISVAEYSIKDTSYTAWVNVNDGLNVRSGSSQDATAVGTLSRGDQVTVTGVVLHNGIENGWVRIKNSALEGYVSAQFLSTSEVSKTAQTEKKTDATRTGEVKTLYFSDGSEVYVYLYTDGTWRSDSGILYWGLTDYDWTNEKGNALYPNKPNTNAASRTGNTMTLYHGNSNIEIVYEYTDGSWRDDYGISYGGWPGNGYMTSSTGETLYTYDPVSAQYSDSDSDEPANIILNGENGVQTVIYSDGAADGSWTDNVNRYYRYNAYGTWICDGVYYYEQ